APESKGFEYKLASAEDWTVVSSTEGETPFYANVTGLEANSAYVYKAFIVVTGTGTIYGNEENFTTLAIVPPTVTTLAVTNITATSATFNGEVTQGTEEIFARGFELKTSTQTWDESFQLTGIGTSPFYLDYPSLTENVNYDVRAYVKTGENGQNVAYGEAENFTATNGGQPTITIGEVTASANVLQSSVELSGEVTEFGGANATDVTVGFKYGLESSLTNDVEEVSATLNGTTFSTTLTDLLPATTYYYVSFMTNSAGTAYSTTGEFTTNNSLSDNIKSGNVNVVMYPNPAEKETKLVISGVNGKVKISLTDVQGRIINTQTIIVNEKTEQSLDLSNLTKGVYYIFLQGENINRTQKLIVK
ncbi:MAG: T9SS type A sorting domain-containing protein, partial [Bacteroidales bacterium]|nr:T9SS type A sorting domain-containing protein [Bacteroidales bacterium]